MPKHQCLSVITLPTGQPYSSSTGIFNQTLLAPGSNSSNQGSLGKDLLTPLSNLSETTTSQSNEQIGSTRPPFNNESQTVWSVTENWIRSTTGVGTDVIKTF
jgi:hypothetical protein